MPRGPADAPAAASVPPDAAAGGRDYAGLGMDLTKRSLIRWEVGRIEHLNASRVVAIEWRHATWAARLHRIGRRIEPEPQVEGVDRSKGHARCGVGEHTVGVYLWWGNRARRHCKRLDAEATDKTLLALSLIIGFDVPLIPRDT